MAQEDEAWWETERDKYDDKTERKAAVGGRSKPAPPPPPPSSSSPATPAKKASYMSPASHGRTGSSASSAAASHRRSATGGSSTAGGDERGHRRRASRGTPWVKCLVESSNRAVWYHSAKMTLTFEDPEKSAEAGAFSASSSSSSLNGGGAPRTMSGISSSASSVTATSSPAPGPGEPASEAVDMDFLELAGGADPAALRRNSAIMSNAWDAGSGGGGGGGGGSVAPSAAGLPPRPGGPVAGPRRGSLFVSRGGGGAGGGGGGGGGGRSDPLAVLMSMKAYADKLLEMGLGDEVDKLLWGVESALSNVREVLEEESADADDRNCVDELLARNSRKDRKSPAAQEAARRFEESDKVKAYRARASRALHSQHEFKQWHAPEYMSELPLPADRLRGVTAVVLLADNLVAANARSELQSSRIPVKEGHTVEDAVRSALTRYRKQVDLPLPDSAYALKALGFDDYLATPQARVTDFAYVRHCVRDGKDPELVLVLRPEAPAGPPAPPADRPGDDVASYPAWYAAKVERGARVLAPHEYRNLTTRRVSWDQLKLLPLAEVEYPFEVKVSGMEGVYADALPRYDEKGTQHLSVEMYAFHGTAALENTRGQTAAVRATSAPRWGETLPASEGMRQCVRLCDMPRESRVCFLVYGCPSKSSSSEPDTSRRVLLGYVVDMMVDAHGRLVQGRRSYAIWPLPAKKGDDEDDEAFVWRATTAANVFDDGAPRLLVEYPEFLLPVVAPVVALDKGDISDKSVGVRLPAPDKKQLEKLLAVVRSDPLAPTLASSETKQLVWAYRHHITNIPEALPIFLGSTNWHDSLCRREAVRMMHGWKAPRDPVTCLLMLDSRFADYSVRQLAVTCLRQATDEELQPLLLQLVQCLKLEPYDDSPLVRFLMERALRSPYDIGHFLFWNLKAEVTVPEFSERFSLVIEEYLSHCGRHALELRAQNRAVLRMQRVAELIVSLKVEHRQSDEQCMERYQRELEKLNTGFFDKMGSFQMPLNPKQRARRLIVEKCRYMSSKKIPLWLVFENEDPAAKPIYVIFKSGDDLRQDMLTLQLLRLMDREWLGSEKMLDMRLKPYRCIATGVNDDGEGVGMIEVVLNSDTTSGIQLKYGGGAKGALMLDPLDKFIRDHNQGSDYDDAVQNFIRSCAGYCVATYVLGIGDRHNGNIMVTRDGHLFHIDFGHFLGNFKSKFGFKRERAPFVFTPEMAFVMGGSKYKSSVLFKTFVKLCVDAFHTLRQSATMLETMFLLMVPAGMPELQCAADIEYAREKLLLASTDKAAGKTFLKDMNKSLDSTWRRIDNAIHNIRHG